MAVWGLYFCIPLIWMHCLDFPAIPPRLFLYDLNTPLTVDEVIEKDIITNYDVETSPMAQLLNQDLGLPRDIGRLHSCNVQSH